MKKKKRAITLLEIMIVIFLIALIGGVVGYNMKGSMDKGKAFKTNQAIARVKDILYLVASEQQKSLEEVVNNPEQSLQDSGLVKNASNLLKDGWGERMTLTVESKGARENKQSKIVVNSKALERYNAKMKIAPEVDEE